MKMQTTDEWVEDCGYCIFFHFENFEEPPEICCDTPLTTGFDTDYWTHFTVFDFNEVIEQAQKINDDGATQQNNEEFEKWFDKQLDNGTAFTSEEQITSWAWQAAKADSEHQTGEMIRAISLAADAREAALEREIAELRAEIKCEEQRFCDAYDLIYKQSKEKQELQAHIHVLREALLSIGDDETGSTDKWAWDLSRKTLASTPEQSMINHDNEVIERCAKACENLITESFSKPLSFDDIAIAIRALKGK